MPIVRWFFGFLFVLVGGINIGWGNDPVFGLFIAVLALVYFPPITTRIEQKSGFRIRGWMLVLLGLLIFWMAMGVGELPEKISMMRRSWGLN